MADIFVSYARLDKVRVAPLVAALETQGFSIWWDSEITPGQSFDELIVRELNAARAVVVVWTPVSVGSRWVRGESRLAADRGVLVPVRFDSAQLPIDALSLHTTDLDEWREDPQSPAFQQLLRALTRLVAPTVVPPAARVPGPSATAAQPRTSLCVLPFTNMSGDLEQEYFSDGITEDIITDLGKVSALTVSPRNTSFTYKGKAVDVAQVGRQMKVGHVLEGSVRKSGNRVRISAQLIDCATNRHIWAERFDRDLCDIFALQDEISQAIVNALKVRLLPEEQQAIAHRGTSNPEAYKLYLMARQFSFAGNLGSLRQREAIVRLCKRAIELDPAYAQAWALLAFCQASMRLYFGISAGEDGLEAADRALALDQNLAEAHAARTQIFTQSARYDDALAALEIALRLDPESYEVNIVAAYWNYSMGRIAESVPYWDKASQLTENDFLSRGMQSTCHWALGDKENAKLAAQQTLTRAERVVAAEPDNGSAMGFIVGALLFLGDRDRALEWMQRALVLDPDNLNMRYNFACGFIATQQDLETGLELLEPIYASLGPELLIHARNDPDLAAIRELPRFKAMEAAAAARLAAGIT